MASHPLHPQLGEVLACPWDHEEEWAGANEDATELAAKASDLPTLDDGTFKPNRKQLNTFAKLARHARLPAGAGGRGQENRTSEEVSNMRARRQWSITS